MGEHNSLGVYTRILERLVIDIAVAYVDSSELHRELNKMRARCLREGFSFLTKTLPAFGKSLDRALQGTVPFTPVGFQKRPGRSTPKFLWWLIERIFDEDGYVRSDADIDAIKHVRQITQLLYKLELPANEQTSQKVVDSFVAVQIELSKLDLDPRDAIIKRARALVARVLEGLSPWEIKPRHGPGAVATGEKGSQKGTFSRLYTDMENCYPFTGYFQFSVSHTVDHLHKLSALKTMEIGTAKVVLVPKDSRGPRLISCEPLEKQWIQQGQRAALYSHIEHHPLTRGQINFTDQGINRRLALQSSKTGAQVTLDMKEASDRVSLKLVEQLFCGTPWYTALVASRSGQTKLPDGTVVKLETFAPMGSAVCFPVEALAFWALAVSTLVVHEQAHSEQAEWVSLEKAARSVFVYGDDIICDVEDYDVVMQSLEHYGLRFNNAKCCVSGLFRESCGCDAYGGVDVTPIRLRKTWNHHSPYDAVQLQSYVSFSNEMYARGYRGTALWVEGLVDSLYKLPVPYLNFREVSDYEWCLESNTLKKKRTTTKGSVASPGRVIGYNRPDVNPYPINLAKGCRVRFNRHTHTSEVEGYAIIPRRETWTLDGWEAVLHSTANGPQGLHDGIHTTAVPRRSRIKRTWGTV